MDNLKLFIEKHTELPKAEWEEITKYFDKRTIKKDEILLAEGKVCKYLYFLESGLLRFYILKDGNEITKFFTIAPYFFTSQASFNSGKPATENIQALENATIWRISKKQTEELFVLKSWNSFARKIIQEVQFFTEQILEEIQTETAEMRYNKMLTQNPELVQRIPLKHLASFLGIAPQSLSRIRKKLTKK
jgi:CRP-like cAMP-binding protein